VYFAFGRDTVAGVEREPSAGRNQPVAGSLVEVQVLQLPLGLWQRAQEHTDGLVRELALIVQDAEAPGGHPPAAARARPGAQRRVRRVLRGTTAGNEKGADLFE